MTEIAVVILAAGKGTRMKSALPKVLHKVAGRPMVAHVLATAAALTPSRRVVVVGSGMDQVAPAVAEATLAVQEPQLGTGHAVMQARAALAGFAGDVLVLYGDVPLLTEASLRNIVDTRRSRNAALAVLGFVAADPGRYGRLVVNGAGDLERIVEYKDASEAERAITLCNSGVMAIDGAHLFRLLDKVTNQNAQGEYYLTDLVGLARAEGLGCAYAVGDEAEVLGVNSRAELAAAEGVIQNRLRQAAMENGATLLDPASVYLNWDTKIGRDVIIEPHVFFGPKVTVGDNVVIHAFSHIEGATIGEAAEIGPYARLRPGAELGADTKVGNFVEIKKAVVEPGAKVNHLTYIGDARVGAKANIGAGTITCNYDGFDKSFTDIGAGAFIGSNSSLVAPVKIGDGAIVGAGSVVTRDVPADALGVTRAEQKALTGWAATFRAKKAAAKKAKNSDH